jgi:ferritin-like metal-binding protein YciE
MKLDSLETLLVEELRDLYNAERQILKALPKMAKASSSPDLEKGFREHLQQTQTQVERLDKIFADLGKVFKRQEV